MKVKVIMATYSDCYECEGNSTFFPVAGDWEEIDEKDYPKYREAVVQANMRLRKARKWSNESYVLISYDDNTSERVFADASAFVQAQKDAAAEEERKKAEAKRKRDAAAKERKRKQFEKLKKELGE